MGLSGESGEIIDHLKKALFHGHALDEKELAKELGDLMWYVANFADAMGWELELMGTRKV